MMKDNSGWTALHVACYLIIGNFHFKVCGDRAIVDVFWDATCYFQKA